MRLTAVLLAVQLLVAGCADGGQASTAATTGPSPEQQRRLLDDLDTWSGDAYDTVGYHHGSFEGASAFTLGEPMPLYQTGRGFLGASDRDLVNHLELGEGAVMMPIECDGRLAGMLVAAPSRNDDNWFLRDVKSLACAEEVLAQPDGHMVLQEAVPARQAFYAVLGETVTPLQSCSAEGALDVATLADYRDRVLAETRYFTLPPELVVGSLAALALAAAAIAWVMWRRRARRHLSQSREI